MPPQGPRGAVLAEVSYSQRPAVTPAPVSWTKRNPPQMLALLLAIWLWRHPWEGIWHDNTLYAAQALHWLQPQVFGHDLFFLYGSQASYTLFTPLYAAAVSALGLYGGTLALLSCSYVAWIAAAAFLLRCFLHGRYFWLGMVILFSLPSDYGPVPDLFRLAEPFLTPRPFAEALSMLALAFGLRNQLRQAALAALLACLLHPLMGLACAASLLFYAGRSHPWRIVVLLVLGAGVAAAGAWLSVAPFNHLLQQMDEAWYARVVEAAYLVTWSAWRSAEWGGRTALAFSMVLTAALLAEGALRRIFCSIALTGVLGLAATWLGTGVYHNVLITQLQPWRALWLVQLAALFALPWLAARCWSRGSQFRLLLLALFLAYLARDSVGAVLGVAASVALWRLDRQVKPVALPRPLLLTIAAAMLFVTITAWLVTLQHMVDNWMALTTPPYLPYQYLYLLAWALLKTGGGATMALALFGILAANGWRRAKSGHLTVFGVLTAALLLAVVTGNHQQVNSIYRDPATVAEIRSRFLPLIGPSAIVYWEDDIQVPWFVLERASYASNTQLIGLVFNRGTAIEGYRRLERLRPLGVPDSITGQDPQLRQEKINRLPKASFAGLVHVCHDPVLDFVVLTKRFEDGVVQQAADRRHQQTFYLYDCVVLRGRYADSL